MLADQATFHVSAFDHPHSDAFKEFGVLDFVCARLVNQANFDGVGNMLAVFSNGRSLVKFSLRLGIVCIL